ncbi:hypothetical protein IVA79_11740 [Bradyrhizobium sp. 138]|uniref:hypothetical protein n=1 Tax=Bradyrhizobium sp. 138 TaxID=2782615 RepID=UPI001FFB747A|nr:hypothetical protein [Bradyrhizobium sp. 138]MCK1734611.1 hypothetical protein [Bradyrhizobium sp. 138]
MKMKVNSKTTQLDLYRVTRRLLACALLMFVFLMIKPAVAVPQHEARATFDRFVAAQNAHDVQAVEALLLASPDFLWITRGPFLPPSRYVLRMQRSGRDLREADIHRDL